MFSYYTMQTGLTVLLMIFLAVNSFCSEYLSRKRARSFTGAFALVGIAGICEWLGVYMNGNTAVPIRLHAAIKAIELSVAPVIPVMMAVSIGRTDRVRMMLCIMMLNVFMELTSVFSPVTFGVDESNVYYHAELYAAYYVFVMAGILFLIFETIIVNTRNQYFKGPFLAGVLVLMLGGMVPHIIRTEWRVEWLTTSVTVALFYIYYMETTLVMDGLTKLFCRAAYEHNLRGLHGRATLVTFDVDDFKNCNDRYGHAYGDEVLIGAANAIKSVYGRYGRCYRIGGDEFAAILIKGNPDIASLNSGFDALIAGLRQNDGRYPGVSYGFHPIDSSDVSAILAAGEADAMLYKNKGEKKSN